MGVSGAPNTGSRRNKAFHIAAGSAPVAYRLLCPTTQSIAGYLEPKTLHIIVERAEIGVWSCRWGS